MLTFTIAQVDTSGLEAYSTDELKKAVRLAAFQSVGEIRQMCQRLVGTAIDNSETAISLRSGDLRSLLGLGTGGLGGIDGATAVEAIKSTILNNIVTEVISANGSSFGGVRVEILIDDFSDVLQLSEAVYSSINKYGQATPIPWLDWLLTKGNSLIITEWEVLNKGAFKGTRTGTAVMVHPTKRPAKGFQIPPQFAGVTDKNWLTDIIDSLEPTINDQICQIFERNF